MEFKIKVEDMHCGHCVSRIDNALNEVGIKHQINLEEKTVIIDNFNSYSLFLVFKFYKF